MNRLISVVLLVLLVASSGFAAWQYSENQRLASENTQLKTELDTAASKIADADAERMNLEHELNQTRQQLNATEIQVAQLQGKIAQLEENITAIRQQLQDKAMRKGAITIGLTFVWNERLTEIYPPLQILPAVNYMNEKIWAQFRVYFFVYHANAEKYMPTMTDCNTAFGVGVFDVWVNTASAEYPGRDIPVGLFVDLGGPRTGSGVYMGCEVGHAIAMYGAEFTVFGRTGDAGRMLAHEILHVFQFTDSQLSEETGLGNDSPVKSDMVPLAWSQQIQSNAQLFQMPLPST